VSDLIPDRTVDFTLVAQGVSSVLDFFEEPLLRAQNIQDRDMLCPGRDQLVDSAFALRVAVPHAMSVELSPCLDPLYEPLPHRARSVFVEYPSVCQESIVRSRRG
jgi:hypothetical protein